VRSRGRHFRHQFQSDPATQRWNATAPIWKKGGPRPGHESNASYRRDAAVAEGRFPVRATSARWPCRSNSVRLQYGASRVPALSCRIALEPGSENAGLASAPLRKDAVARPRSAGRNTAALAGPQRQPDPFAVAGWAREPGNRQAAPSQTSALATPTAAKDLLCRRTNLTCAISQRAWHGLYRSRARWRSDPQ